MTYIQLNRLFYVHIFHLLGSKCHPIEPGPTKSDVLIVDREQFNSSGHIYGEVQAFDSDGSPTNSESYSVNSKGTYRIKTQTRHGINKVSEFEHADLLETIENDKPIFLRVSDAIAAKQKLELDRDRQAVSPDSDHPGSNELERNSKFRTTYVLPQRYLWG